jgi:hypothetical protein
MPSMLTLDGRELKRRFVKHKSKNGGYDEALHKLKIISPCRKAKGRDYSDEFIADFALVEG